MTHFKRALALLVALSALPVLVVMFVALGLYSAVEAWRHVVSEACK